MKEVLENFLKKDFYEVLCTANTLRRIYKGDVVELCAIVNAKSGACSGDCKFCAQSAKHKTGVKVYPLLEVKDIIPLAKKAKEDKVKRFSLVTSGIKLSKKEVLKLGEIIEKLISVGISLCASVGLISKEEIKYLKDCGLTRLHCNLETSEEFFPKICTTHSFYDKVKTLESAKEVGLSVCSGGIFGIGETWEDRLSLALTLKKLDVDSVPVNFLIPIKGTPLESTKMLEPFEALRIIAFLRLILPEKDIRIAGGRKQVLKDFSSWIFIAGANALMTGNYLTTKGVSFEEDLNFIKLHELYII